MGVAVIVTFVISRGESWCGYVTRGRRELESDAASSLLGNWSPGPLLDRS